MSREFNDLFQNAAGFPPYSYQRKLALAEIMSTLSDIPTGLGKTLAVLLAWLWKRRFADNATQGNTPRRLVYCLPMRVLVEQTFEVVVRCLARLDLLAGKASWFEFDHNGIPTAKAEFISYDPDPSDRGRIAVHLLMGGEGPTDGRFGQNATRF